MQIFLMEALAFFTAVLAAASSCSTNREGHTAFILTSPLIERLLHWRQYSDGQ